MQKALWLPSLGILLCAVAHTETKLPPAARFTVDFNKHVLPILSEKCFGCHGSIQQQSGLRLDKRQNALRGGDYGPVILPGRSSESKLIRRLVDGDGGMQMPPTGALSAEEIGILRAWIDQGGEYGDVEVRDSAPPAPVDPRVKSLIRAIRARDDRSVRQLIEADPKLARGRDAGGSTPLHHAAGFGSIESMRLLLDRGADVNAKNSFEGTALHWAIPDEAKSRLLLDHGAEPSDRAMDGRTPLYLAASARNAGALLKLLLERRADPNLALLAGRTPLMAAAANGDVAAMRLLIAGKADVNQASSSGSTALFDAAGSANVGAVRLLLEAGANAKTRTKRGQSALAVACEFGAEDIVKLLLDSGAEVNTRDERGYSPLMYAAYSETMPAGIVRLLLSKGADRSYEGEGETALSLAGKRGDNEVARLLGVPEKQRAGGGVPAVAVLASARQRSVAAAIEQGASAVAAQSPNFIKRGGCNSCHNQMLPAAAFGLAREHGAHVPAAIAELPVEMVERSPERTMDMGVIGVNSVAYEIFGFIGARRPADEYTDALVHYLKATQAPEGNWTTTGSRPPLTSDHFQTTGMVVYALREYSPVVEKADTDERLARAAAWLESNRPVTTQERAFQVLGLRWAGGSAAAIASASRELAATQRPDGGWSQLPGMGTDAYATGEALYALGTAGMTAGDTVYSKGVRYLLDRQAADGTWHVKTRSLPFQPYFESGFPYGHDQWISSAGTSWAIMALSLAMEAPRTAAR
jgi:ankyrin repeat protein